MINSKKIFQSCIMMAMMLLLMSTVKAQHRPVYTSLLQGDSIKAGKSATVQDTVFFNPSLQSTVMNTQFVNNIITFRINESSTRMLPDSFKASVRMRLYYTNGSNVQDSIAFDTLSITYYKNKAYRSRSSRVLQNAYRLQLTIIGVDFQYADSNAVRPSLELENRLVMERDFLMSCTADAIQAISKDTTTIAAEGELLVYWVPDLNVEAYDLEWTYIDKSALDNGHYNTGGSPDAKLIFRNNATRVTIVGNEYKIPLLYDGQGSLFFRVRGVQVETSGETKTTNWSSSYSGGLGRYDFNGHQRNLNWQATTSFAEEGKRSSVVSYADGSLRARQTVTKDNSTGTTVVAETLYDKQGRPVIQVMPAPTLSQLIKYTPAFNVLNMNGAEYDKGVYDTLLAASDYCNVQSDSMSALSGATKYYSSRNELVNQGFHKFIPDAHGYAFVQTQYSQDNTGRVTRQSGVDIHYRLGSGKETKYYYSTPEQTDLDALFGTEAGDASHYQKMMVQDANGQYSVSYTDMHGRTIATALAGSSPSSLQQLSSYLDSVQTESLLTPTNNIIVGNSIVSTKTLLMPKADSVTFSYGLAAESLALEDCAEQNICYDCLYDLTITITDDCNNQLLPGGMPLVIKKSNFRMYEVDTTCDMATPVDTMFKVYLAEGNYNITKKLSISRYGLNYYRDSLYLPHNTCKTYDDFFEEQMEIIKSRLECSDDTAYTPAYLSHRDQMLQDLYPLSGQYADRDTSTHWLSIFDVNETTGRYLYQEVADTAYYINEFNSPDQVYNSAGYLVPPQLLTPEEFIGQFKETWLVNLLSLHPEYKLLVKYDSLAASHLWDDKFGAVEDYRDALGKGYLNPTASARTPASLFTINQTDPLYSFTFHGFPKTAKALMEDSLFRMRDVPGKDSMTLWGFATIQAKCPDPASSACATVYNNRVLGLAFSEDSLCPGELDMAWRIFRNMYLYQKWALIDTFIRHGSAVPYPQSPLNPAFPRRKDLLAEAQLGEYLAGEPSYSHISEEQTYYNTNCYAYRSQWKEQLSSCDYDTTQMNVIINYLTQVCIEGADRNHPLGASSVKPSSTYRFSNFEEVIAFVNDSLSIPTGAACNSYLLDRPLPYGQNAFPTTQTLWSKPDSCQCATINTHYTQYQLVSSSYADFSDYIHSRLQVTISQGALDSLMDLCDGTITCKFIEEPIQLPAALQCGTVPACIDCAQFKQASDSFAVKFPALIPLMEEADTIQQRKNRIYASYMNAWFGFRKTAQDYLVFKDSCNNSFQEPAPGDTTLSCNTLNYFVSQYYYNFVKPAWGYVDLDMRTFAGTKTPVDGPKGVFDVNGLLIGNTDDGTTEEINESYAEIWNSNAANQAVGVLSVLENGQFRLTLNPGQSAPCNGIIGQRFYQYEAHPLDSTAGYIRVGEGSYVDFGDGTHVTTKDYSSGTDYGFITYQDAQSSITQYDYSGHFGENRYYVPNRTPARIFTVQHKYYKPLATRQTYTVTVYHTDVKGAISFYGPRTTVTDHTTALQTNLRGYWPQQLIHLDFYSIQDSTMSRTREIKNFNEISTIEHLEISNRSQPVFNINLGSFAGNHNLQYLYYIPAYSVIPGYTTPAHLDSLAGKHFYEVLPNFSVNFPQLGYVTIGGLNRREADLDMINFELPELRGLSVFAMDTLKSYQGDSLFIQLARVNNQLNGAGVYGFGTASVGAFTSASLSARNHLTTNGWNVHGMNSSTFPTSGTTLSNRIEEKDSMVRTNAFTEMLNAQLGTHYTFDSLQEAYLSQCGVPLNLCSPPLMDTVDKLCPDPSGFEMEYLYKDPCADSTIFAVITATELYRHYLDSLKNHFNEAYTQKCLQAVNLEEFTVTHPVNEYHYTLYYYDLAGNLVKTIPPEGVYPNRNLTWLSEIKTKRAAGEWQVPDHGLPTVYRYNSLNQVVTQQSPDGGYSSFWYDRLGRLVVSKNAKQNAVSKYSFTRYDELGRITEVGEKLQYTAMTQTISRDPQALHRWIEKGNLNSLYAPKQLTVTTYDKPSLLYVVYGGFTPFRQKTYTLRNRVSYSRLFEASSYTYTVNGSDTTYVLSEYNYDHAMEYSYDIHGNVDSLLQLYGGSSPFLTHGGNRFKMMSYQYDLVSGKVNQVHYQPGKNDELYHRYEYDAQNRLTDVYVTDQKVFIGQSLLEEHDAHYEYYKHGPLARTVIGQQQVQGLDYAYTVQGWLKGVNSTALNTSHDMGGDALISGTNQYVAKDAYGFNLNYFTGEYASINTTVTPFPGHSGYLSLGEYRLLYNGNISSMAVNIGKFNQPQLYNYQYDQLNRIVSMDVYRGFNESSNSWSALTSTTDYKERIAYDGNGNILKYLRNGTVSGGGSLAMDSLNYKYNWVSGKLQNNKLRHVNDQSANTANYTVDIDNQGDDNYLYDEIGNLVKDNAEGIDDIDWTVYGKIDKITKANGTEIKYHYDVAGNRITKAVTTGGQTAYTSYVRDASGNVMGVYEQVAGSETMKLKEHHLYGSSRLGLWSRDLDIDQPKQVVTEEDLLGDTYIANFERGHKFFELSNHLGNVLVTISDKKNGVDDGSNGTIDYYTADVVTANDYYPFGMLMPGRKYALSGVEGYRYGFNGKENDNDVKGEGNQQDYGMRIYDPRVGRFLSVDPLASSYPWYTPYQFAGNKPIWAIDLDGLEPVELTTNEEDACALENVTITSARPKEATTRLAEKWGVSGSTGGAAAYKYQEMQYYHRGSGVYNTKAGWYNKEQYIEELTKNSSGMGSSFGLDLAYASNARFNEQARTTVRPDGDCRLENFTNEIGNPDPQFFQIMGLAAVHAVNNRNFYVSGFTEPTPFNVEDVVGAILIAKAIFKALLIRALHKIDNEALILLKSYNSQKSIYLDCSEIAAEINTVVKDGSIYEIKSATGRWMQGIEYGEETQFTYHQFFVKEGLVYDPMFGSNPIKFQDFISKYYELNPQGLIINKIK